MKPRIAVLVPCYNEETAIATVVRDFKAALPDAVIHVYDNNSGDQTMARAAEAGAVVRSETRQGKGNVVRRMFADIEADIYVLVDGDDTYDAGAAPRMVRMMTEDGVDLVTARRVHVRAEAFRPGHVLGNRMLTGLTAALFQIRITDMLSGYRVFSRRFVKSFPFTATGFGIETELTVHAVRLMMPLAEMDTRYKERPVGSVSKLNTWRDGFRILLTIAHLLREERPMVFFTVLFLLLAAASLLLGAPVVAEYFQTGLVPRLPTAVLATSLMLIAFLSLACGVILDTVTRGRWEAKRMAYLSIAGPQGLGHPVTAAEKAIRYLLAHPYMRFAMVGGVGFTVDTMVLAFNTHVLGFPFLLARAISISVAMCFTYLGNRHLTFADRRAHGASAILREWITFVAANSFGAVVNYSVSALVVYLLPPPLNNQYVGLVCGVAVGMVLNFTLSKKLVFKG